MTDEKESNLPENASEEQIYSETGTVSRRNEDMMESTVVTEMLENMPSYMARGFIYVLLFVIVVALVYSYFGKMDVLVQGKGKLIPQGEAAVVQSAKSGLLNKLFVNEGDMVAKGDVLAKLDVTRSNIEAEKRQKEYLKKKRQRDCIDYAITVMNKALTGKNVRVNKQEILQLCSDDYVASVVGLKNAKMVYDKAMMQAEELYPRSIKTMMSAVENKELNLKNKQKQLQAAKKDLLRAVDQLSLYQEMFKKGLASKVKLLEEQKKYDEALAKVDESRVAINGAENELEDARVKLKTSRINYGKMTQQARETYDMAMLKYRAMLSNMQLKLDNLNIEISNFELDSKLVKYERTFDEITSPVDGRISFIKLRNAGEMVKAGDTIFTINPSNRPLVAKVMIPNKSVGRLKAGMEAKLKFDAFPYQHYGIVKGRVIEISPDSKKVEKSYFFETTISLDKEFVTKDGTQYQLFTGLTLLSEVVVEKRRIIENFLAPLKSLKG